MAGNVLALAMLLLHAAIVQGRKAAKISVAAVLRALHTELGPSADSAYGAALFAGLKRDGWRVQVGM